MLGSGQKDSESGPETESQVSPENFGKEVKAAIGSYLSGIGESSGDGIFKKEVLQGVLKIENKALYELAEKSQAAQKDHIHKQQNSDAESLPEEEEEPGARQRLNLSSAIFLATCAVSGIWGVFTVGDFYRYNYKKTAIVQAIAAFGFFLAMGAWYDDTYKDDAGLLFGIAAVLEGSLAVYVYHKFLRNKVWHTSQYNPDQPAAPKEFAGTVSKEVKKDFLGYDSHSVSQRMRYIWGASAFWMVWGAYEVGMGANYIHDVSKDGFQLAGAGPPDPERILMNHLADLLRKYFGPETPELKSAAGPQ